MTLEEILKTNGYTEADLESLKPMLSDSRFRNSLEQTYGALATERDTLKALDQSWNEKLEKEYNPAITAAQAEAQKARLEAAQVREQWKILKDYGYVTPEFEAEILNKAPASAAPTSTTNENFITREALNRDISKFAEVEGEAIARAIDIEIDYHHLTGKSLFDYQATIGDRTLRGMSALRAEAKSKGKQDLYGYASEKFGFAEKREQKIQEARLADENRIRQDERSKALSDFTQQYGSNPNTRFAMPSNVPAIPKPRQEQSHPFKDEGGMSSIARKEARINHALSAEAQARNGKVM
jgi:hypothetical protein